MATIEISDLIWGLVVEDQIGFAKALSLIPEAQVDALRSAPAAQSAPSFLAADAANRILQQVGPSDAHLKSKPHEAEIRMSSAVKHALGVSRALLQKDQGESLITPLHLLAAVSESSDESAGILRAEGLTQERMVQHLRKRK